MLTLLLSAIRTAFVTVACIVALAILPAVASAVLPGANGRILYASGRGVTDAQAKLYTAPRSAASELGSIPAL